MQKIFKRFGLTLAAALLLTSMFGGVALAKGDKSAIENANLMNSTATILSLSADPVATFKSLPSNTQERVKSNLLDAYQKLNNVPDWEIVFYNLPTSIQTLIYIDIVYACTTATTTYTIMDDEGNVLTAQEEQLAQSVTLAKSSYTTHTISTYLEHWGSLLGWPTLQWQFFYMLEIRNYGDYIVVVDETAQTEGLWDCHGQSNYKGYVGTYFTGDYYFDEEMDTWYPVHAYAAKLVCVAYKFTHLFDTKYGYIELGMFLDYSSGIMMPPRAYNDMYTNTSQINSRISSMSGYVNMRYYAVGLPITES